MTFYRKPSPVEAFQWDRNADPRSWPEWAQLWRGNDSTGQNAAIGFGGTPGTLSVPGLSRNGVAEHGDWIVFDGTVTDDGYGRKTARGTVTVVKPADFAEQFISQDEKNDLPEPAPGAPAADAVTPSDAPAEAAEAQPS